MKHYICTGDCKATSPEAGICQSDFCNKAGEELKICGCEDGSHSEHTTTEAPQEETQP